MKVLYWFKFVTAFKDHMFYAGKSSTPQEVVFSQPFDEDTFSSGSGAGSVKVDDTVTGLKYSVIIYLCFVKTEYFKWQDQVLVTLQ